MALRAEEIQDPGFVDLDRDRSLVLRYQQGDEGAFDDLYRRYYPRLHLYCQRRVGDAHAAEELAQEAFVRALRAMPGFAGERRFYPWMTVIAQRLCIDHHRRSSRMEPSADIDLGTVEPDHDALYAAVDHDHLSEAMTRLAPRHREVLDLREGRGWSYHQIGEHLDVPVTTVEALLHRARKALKREFLAVSSGTRLAGMPIIGWVVMRLAGVRARVSGKTATQLAPVAGSAAAGFAALSLVLTPFGAAAPPPAIAAPQAILASAHPAAAVTPVATPAGPLSALDTTATAASTTRARAATPPPSAVDGGPLQVYSGGEGTQYAQSENAQQPVQVDLGPVQVGGNPQQTIDDVINHVPGGIP